MGDRSAAKLAASRAAGGLDRARRMALCVPCLTLLFGFLTAMAQDRPSLQSLQTLTTTRAVHGLTMDQAARGFPIHLRATVTYYDPYLDYPQPILMVTDSTGSVFVKLPLKSVAPLRAGQLVEVRGQSLSGGFAADVGHPEIRVLGQSRLPATAPLRSLTELMQGKEDAPFVEMEGILHDAVQTSRDVILKVVSGNEVFTAVTPIASGVDYSRFVNARVRIRGIACSLFNARHQLVGVQLRFAGLGMLSMREPAPGDPFDETLSPINSLMRYMPNQRLDHRVHVEGIVTIFEPGRLLCVQSGSDGVCAQTRQSAPVTPGQFAEVVGFPQIGNYAPTLVDALYRIKKAPGHIVIPAISAEQALRGEHETELVEIDGELVGMNKAALDPTIVLSTGAVIYTASLPGSPIARILFGLEDGSRLRIRGFAWWSPIPRARRIMTDTGWPNLSKSCSALPTTS